MRSGGARPINGTDRDRAGAAKMTCPICSKDTTPAYRPFCSRRCADEDLTRWLTGAYAIPSADPEDIRDAEEALDPERSRPH